MRPLQCDADTQMMTMMLMRLRLLNGVSEDHPVAEESKQQLDGTANDPNVNSLKQRA